MNMPLFRPKSLTFFHIFLCINIFMPMDIYNFYQVGFFLYMDANYTVIILQYDTSHRVEKNEYTIYIFFT